MADPISLISLGTGLISLGLQLCGGITTYLDAVKCRDEDIASIKRQNEALRSVLQVVKTSLPHHQPEYQASDATVTECFQSCETEFKALESLVAQLSGCNTSPASLKEKVRDQTKRLRYTFHRSKLLQLEERLNRANVTLQLALQGLGIDISRFAAEKLVAIESVSQTISAGIYAVQSDVSALSNTMLDIRDSLPTVQRVFETVGHSVHLEAGALSASVLEGNQVLRHEILSVRGFLESSLRSQREQLISIDSQSSIQNARLDSVERLLEELCGIHSPSEAQMQPKVTPESMIGRLIAKPRTLKQICDKFEVPENVATNLHESANCSSQQPADPGALRSSMVAFSMRGSILCSCRPVRRLNRKRICGAWLDVYYESKAKEHLPSCTAAQTRTDNCYRTIGLGYNGLAKLLKFAVKISFNMSSGAGGWSISPTFTYYPTVDETTAPAFRILKVMDDLARSESRRIAEDGRSLLFMNSEWDECVAFGLTKILKLFQDRRQTPLAVDSQNRSLIHHVAKLIFKQMWHGQDSAQPLLGLLRAFLLYDVPATDYDVNGDTPLRNLSRIPGFCNMDATEMIFQLDAEITPVTLRNLRNEYYPLVTDLEIIRLFGRSSNMAKAYECGPLSLAVLANEHDRVKYLLEHHPDTLNEHNKFGQSPLHLAADKPCYLRLFVQRADYKMLNQRDVNSWSVLDYAMLFSSGNCCNGSMERRCSQCDCAESVVILLEADCAVPIPERGLWRILQNSSKRSKTVFIYHMKDRRERLRRLALDNLSVSEAEGFRLRNGKVLDTYAPRVIELLRERDIQIPDPLSIKTGGDLREYESIYREPLYPADANHLFNLGFRDIDPPQDEYLPPLVNLGLPNDNSIPFIHWLVKRGADLFHQLSPASPTVDYRLVQGTFSAHYVFGKIGSTLFSRSESTPFISRKTRRSIHELNAAVLPAGLADNCRCACSPGGCSPFIYMLKRMFHKSFTDDISLNTTVLRFYGYLELFGKDLRTAEHVAALRFLIFTALDIAHTCCSPVGFKGGDNTQGDIDEVREEEASILVIFEELMEDFEGRIMEILELTPRQRTLLADFWKGYWLDRMDKVLGELNGSEITETERRGAEEIGVVWNDQFKSNATQNPYDKDTMEHWFYALDEIVPE